MRRMDGFLARAERGLCPNWRGDSGFLRALESGLTERILRTEDREERLLMIRKLESDRLRAELACRIQAPRELDALLNRITDERILAELIMDPRSAGVPRAKALRRIRDHEKLYQIAVAGPPDFRQAAGEYLADQTRDAQTLTKLANDPRLSLEARRLAALALGDSPALAALQGTALYQLDPITRRMIDRSVERLSRKREGR